MQLRTFAISLSVAFILVGCASPPVFPKLDRSSHLHLSSIAKHYGVPSCSVSVPLTKSEVLRAAKLQGDPHPERRASWKEMVAVMKSGDQLRQVRCLTTGPSGFAAGDVFYGLFRAGKMVAEMHTVIIN